ncbi:hypothetical protein [Dyella flagellata]|nr:hypothetical protein [Dyella flagellata]
MKYTMLVVCIGMACPGAALASSRVCQDQKYITEIATDRSTGEVTRKWFIAYSNEPRGALLGAIEGRDSPKIKIRINGDRASMADERGRALYVLATNAMNNGYQVRLVDNFGKNCEVIDEIDIFRGK